MIIIDEILVSDEVVEEAFACNLSACKGACCWEGDYGAPLEEEEKEILVEIFQEVRPFLREEGIRAIEENGPYTWYEKAEEYGTTLVEGGACAFLTYDKNGIAKCGIEKAYEEGATSFQKPISCHLYPIRIKQEPALGLEILNYDRWDICSAACEKGKAEKIPLYLFVKGALIRKYGVAFFKRLQEAVTHLSD
jgi:hypothetical protein